MKFGNCYCLEYSDYQPHLHCYTSISAEEGQNKDEVNSQTTLNNNSIL